MTPVHSHSQRFAHAAFGLGIAVTALLAPAQTHAAEAPAPQPYTTWTQYGGTSDSMQYSALRQINKSNVKQLELAWHYPVPDRTGNFGFNPVVVDGVMYVLGQQNRIVALDAASGKQLWSHAVPGGGGPGNRGITYWESKDRSDRRLIYAAGGAIRQLNAQTGEAITTFGDNGRVVMRTGYPRVQGSPSGTPGRVFENLYIAGSNTGEGYFSATGDIRAYDVLTGDLVWTFHTIPRPGEFGHDTWPPEAWKYAGGANCWGEISIDEKHGIAYVPTGSPTHDLFGGDRKGDNLFGNCLLALDARTGKRLWHFQTIRHDIWDYDLTTAPKLLTVRHNGALVDAVAQPTKHGLLFVFNRVTGEPLWPIEDRPVPQSDVAAEHSSPTQPFPTKPPPYARLEFKVEDINPYLDPEEQARIRRRLEASRNEGVFTPQTLDRETIMMPGQFGGSNWGGSAADPETGVLYVRSIDHPTIHQLSEFRQQQRPDGGASPAARGRALYAQLCVNCHGELRPDGILTMDRETLIPIRELGNERITTAIRQGQGQMPALTQELLSDGGLRDLLAFLGNPAPEGQGRFAGRNIPEAVSGPQPISPQQEGIRLHTGPRYTGPLGRAFRASNRAPSISPPWSEIVAYDLNDGTIKWRGPFGNYPPLAVQGITGTGNGRRAWRNGPAVTAGGLLFIGSWSDRTVRAFDKDDGTLLWEYELKANPEGIISVFEVNGRQYVALCAAGTAANEIPPEEAFEQWPGLASAQGYYVFALPDATP